MCKDTESDILERLHRHQRHTEDLVQQSRLKTSLEVHLLAEHHGQIQDPVLRDGVQEVVDSTPVQSPMPPSPPPSGALLAGLTSPTSQQVSSPLI